MLLGTLGANSLGNMLPNKSLKAARQRQGRIRAGKATTAKGKRGRETIIAKHDF